MQEKSGTYFSSCGCSRHTTRDLTFRSSETCKDTDKEGFGCCVRMFDVEPQIIDSRLRIDALRPSSLHFGRMLRSATVSFHTRAHLSVISV